MLLSGMRYLVVLKGWRAGHSPIGMTAPSYDAGMTWSVPAADPVRLSAVS